MATRGGDLKRAFDVLLSLDIFEVDVVGIRLRFKDLAEIYFHRSVILRKLMAAGKVFTG